MQRILALAKLASLLIAFLYQSINYGQTPYHQTVEKVQELLEANYIFLDKAKETNAHLDKLMKNGSFEGKTPSDFASFLTQEMRSITKDKHLRFVWNKEPRKSRKKEPSFKDNFSRYRTPMLRGFKLMKGNIGYIDLAYFGGAPFHTSKIDQVMNEMQIADAIIIDMRRNGGGSPVTVNYLSSYFFNEKLLLNTIYSRANNHSEEMWVVDTKGLKRPNVPVYILTSADTFSGAEDFSYTMQSRKRATIIGEVTGGGAHPTRYHGIDGTDFGIRIPFARTVNTVTKTNWEGTGVTPDIKMNADEALNKAEELAKQEAITYSNALFKPLENAMNSLKKDNKELIKQLEYLITSGILDEFEINGLGYSYLLRGQKDTAIAIFNANTILFPDSANVYDSYAEALATNNQNDLALINYQKAVKTAAKNNDDQLELFQNNLKAFQEKAN
ncbi:S41 family peptidase [Aquimarina spongiae]|uniref:N-terminal domain of Peptidase_S41 n=1 Tax=Aquimarina spongiae TaxID=570521 RepID=A0A1M6AXI1_9FLAO|nr:S41 family peptidase [Aquimarina spongiae]SHI41157.1 N-terminal domain of Peptidase_S41 [Aquimarina spongiae]